MRCGGVGANLHPFIFTNHNVMKHVKRNWKTTLLGLIGAAGIALQASDNPKVKLIGIFIGALGIGGAGMVAKDNNKTGLR